jgi:hypothetical protein
MDAVMFRTGQLRVPALGVAAAKEPMERRLAAILCADITGYSRLMGAGKTLVAP